MATNQTPLGPRQARRNRVHLNRNIANDETQKLWTGMEQLSHLLPQFHQLTTFSLFVKTHDTPHGPLGFWLQDQQIFNIIDKLPSSLENLEIDTRGFEQTTTSDTPADICKVIAGHLSHLLHIRLRLSRYCGSLFVPSSTIRSMLINMILPWPITSSQQCGTPAYKASEMLHVKRETGRATRQMLVEKSAQTLASWPSLKSMLIIDHQQRESGSFDMLNVRDILKEKTVSLPYYFVSTIGEPGSKYCLRYYEGDEISDVVGRTGDTEIIAEAYMWVTTKQGSRFPAAYKVSAEGRGLDWDTRKPWQTREQLKKRRNDSPKLWTEEETEGRILLRPREVEGVGEVDNLKRDSIPTDDHEESDPAADAEADEIDGERGVLH
jgi:hypothetical protein